jgi:hypothetical protein
MNKYNRSDKIVIKLEHIPGTRKTDKFNNVIGDMNVNAIKNVQTNLWHLRYDPPATMPMSLQVQFTNFNRLLDFATDYYTKKNLRIKEILDAA